MRPFFTLLMLLLLSVTATAQTTIFDFEGDAPTYDDFNGAVTTIIDNPDATAPNTSDKVVQHVVPANTGFPGVKFTRQTALADGKSFTLQVWSPIADAPMLLKFETGDGPDVERAVNFSGPANSWQEFTFDFISEGDFTYDFVVLFMNFNVEGSEELTFYFDNLAQVFVAPPEGDQMDLPVTFDEEDVNYGVVGFEGAAGNIVTDPTESANQVGEVTKGPGSGTSSGATVTSLPGGPAGFASAIPFTAGETTMSVRVWSPVANIPVRLKVEKADDPTVSVETQVMLTSAMRWDTLVFDFAQEATGTAEINFASFYNKASIFFGFGGLPTEVTNYYFDNLSFGPVPQGGIPTSTRNPVLGLLEVFPNPTQDRMTITAPARMENVSLYGASGRLLGQWAINADRYELDLSQFAPGMYVALVNTADGPMTVKVIKE